MSRATEVVSVGDVMTRKVHTASPEQPMSDILDIFVLEKCHHVPIVERDRPVGIISTRDVVKNAVGRDAGETRRDHFAASVAADIMTQELETIDVAESVDVAIERIGRGDYHALLVLDDEESLVGIVTHHDLLDYLAS